MEEIWKPIKGYEGYYEVSNHGRVKSLARYRKANKGSTRFVHEIITTHRLSACGYYQSFLCKNSIRKYPLTHRIVAEAFIPNPLNKPQVNHIDGVKTNNTVNNLEWCTRSENMKHAYEIGLAKIKNGEERGKKVCKLDNEKVLEIKQMLKIGIKNKDIAIKFNINPVTISNIKTGKLWKHIII